MKEYQFLVYAESTWTAFIPGGGKVDPVNLSAFVNEHAANGWQVVTMERENRRTFLFWKREAIVLCMEREKTN